MRLTPQRYANIKEKADAARRSISEEVEARLERLAAQDSAMAAMGTSLERIKQGNLEAELWRSGYTPIRTSQGKLWAPPGYPGMERSGFVDRAAYPEVPPRVEYRLTPLGASLSGTVRAFDDWVERNLLRVQTAERAFDSSARVRPRSRDRQVAKQAGR